MKFTINIEKKHFYLLAAIISVLGIFTVFAAVPFNPSSPLHPLQQISIDENGVVSVDADSNSIIDNSDKLENLSASAFCKSNGVDCLSTGSSIWTTSGSNIYYNSGNVGIGTTSPTQSLDIIGNMQSSGDVQASSITLGGVTRTTWPGTFVWSPGVFQSTANCACPGGFCDSGSQLSGSCSPGGSTNDYFTTGAFCGCSVSFEPVCFYDIDQYTQTCQDELA